MRGGRRIGLVLLAAGRGARAGFEINKVLMPIAGKSALSRCLDTLWSLGWLDEIVLIARDEDTRDIYMLLTKHPKRAHIHMATGGDTRMESARNGLLALNGLTDICVLHDAARPFADPQLFEAVVDDALIYGSGVISTPVTDTIKQIDDNANSVHTPERARLRAVQTPQAFEYQALLFAHERAREMGLTLTDDAAVYEAALGMSHLTYVEGAERNTKLTTKLDYEIAGARLAGAIRVGQGYDAHRLVEGRKLILCGVEIPFDKGLEGHSDADAPTHALIDAILGALALGDIGELFPDSDDAYLNICSLELLTRVGDIIREKGFRVANADITIIAQRPKCAPYRELMRNNLARALNIDITFVSVKATTTEGMGFEGEGLGISARAICAIAPVWD